MFPYFNNFNGGFKRHNKYFLNKIYERGVFLPMKMYVHGQASKYLYQSKIYRDFCICQLHSECVFRYIDKMQKTNVSANKIFPSKILLTYKYLLIALRSQYRYVSANRHSEKANPP